MISILIYLLLFSGDGDMLSNLETAQYWEVKEIKVTEENMRKKLTLLTPKQIDAYIGQLASEDEKIKKNAQDVLRPYHHMNNFYFGRMAAGKNQKESYWTKRLRKNIMTGQKIMRLMAIRSLGELKSSKSLPELKKLTKSDDPFEQDYARKTIALITGTTPETAKSSSRKEDLPWLITPNTILVGKIDTKTKIDFLSILDKANKSGNSQCMVPVRQLKQQMSRQLLNMLERSGNISLQSIGLSIDEFPGNKYAVTVYIKGHFSSTMLGEPKAKFGEYTSYEINRSATALVRNNTIIVRQSRLKDTDPYSEPNKLISSLKHGYDVLKKNKQLAPYVKHIDPKASVWFAGLIPEQLKNEDYKEFDLKAFYANIYINSNDLSGKTTLIGSKTGLQALTAKFKDENNKKIAFLKEKKTNKCGQKAMINFLQSVSVSNNSEKCEISVKIDNLTETISTLVYEMMPANRSKRIK